jgi:Raf kinase inhibitor-like YbhB/YbcL family protein
MVEKLPSSVGRALETRRAALDGILYHSVRLKDGAVNIAVTSTGFPAFGQLPLQFTSDGIGVSPPLKWANIPESATTLALIVEDADSPTCEPSVHAIAVDIDPRLQELEEGDFTAEFPSTPGNLGRHSFLRQAWLPPDPPPGDGVHHYAFQIFALLPGDEFSDTPGRKELVDVIQHRAIGSGCLIGTYSRGHTDPGLVAPVG